ncbi:uncharacterized protein LOC126282299 [Schistocerca gregaria]|uniref:uncharacterized protein LOC126282299 n=1 Tax=Schistocerca gregaria TaxID=7010 RepID=UPI00211E6DCA|nr:uncharacterized protein LOC126282299 [Schistocerca gregaria]
MDKGQFTDGDRFGHEMGTFLAGQDDRVIDEEGDLDAILEQCRGRDYDSGVENETETGTQVEAAAEVYNQTNEGRQGPARSHQRSSAQVSRVTSPMFEDGHKGDINPILSFLRSMKEEADEQRKKEKEEADEQHKKEKEEDYEQRKKDKEEADEQPKKEKEEADEQHKKEKEEDYEQRKKDKEEGDEQRKKEKEEAGEQPMANPVSGVSVRRSENSEAVSYGAHITAINSGEQRDI